MPLSELARCCVKKKKRRSPSETTSIEQDCGEPDQICFENEPLNVKDPESSSIEDNSLEENSLPLMPTLLNLPAKHDKKFKREEKQITSPLKPFRKITLSFIERPEKSTQTSNLKLNKKHSTKSKTRECEPNLETEFSQKYSLDGAVEPHQVGSTDAENSCNLPIIKPVTQPVIEPIPAKQLSQTIIESKINKETTIKSQTKVKKDLDFGDVPSQIALCAIKRALESTMEADDLFEGIPDSESNSWEQFDDETTLLPNDECHLTTKPPRRWCAICSAGDKEAFGLKTDFFGAISGGPSTVSQEATTHDSQIELVSSSLPGESTSDFASLATSCSSLEWDAFEFRNRDFQHNDFIIPME